MSETIFDTPIEFGKLNTPAGTAVRVSKTFIKQLSWPNRGGSEPKGDGSTK